MRLYWEEKLRDMKAGNIRHHLDSWMDLTSDLEVLDTVKGLPIDLDEEFAGATSITKQPQYPLGPEEHVFVEQEILRLRRLGAISPTSHEPGEFISPIFVRPKDDDSFRLILNLKKLNEHTEYIHFKMDTLASILRLVRPGAYMAKIDIKDAYYSVPIKKSDQKKLKFCFDDSIYQFTVLPNGYSPGPRKFTKLLKPPLSVLRQLRVTIAAYLDDMFTTNLSYERCKHNIKMICDMFESLGFTIHPKKTIFEPSTILEFLGFIIDSIAMTVSLTQAKKDKIKELCDSISSLKEVPIRKVASLIGNFTSSFIAVPEGKLHYRYLEREKVEAIAMNRGDYDALMNISHNSIMEIEWWRCNIQDAKGPIYRGNPSVTISTDASLSGWGACRGITRTGFFFSETEILDDTHINHLEAKAVRFGLASLCDDLFNTHILVLSDNTATVGALNNMGSSKSYLLNREIKLAWDWVLERDNWISASHIPGKLNVEADEESRRSETRTEWKLSKHYFDTVIAHFCFDPVVDLFATRINSQLDRFFAYRPDPEAEAIDAFTVSWSNIRFYAFPPFNCIDRVLQKIIRDKATGILIVPDWPSQFWYHMFQDIVIIDLLLPPRSDLLILPNRTSELHPLHEHLALRTALVSGEQ